MQLVLHFIYTRGLFGFLLLKFKACIPLQQLGRCWTVDFLLMCCVLCICIIRITSLRAVSHELIFSAYCLLRTFPDCQAAALIFLLAPIFFFFSSSSSEGWKMLRLRVIVELRNVCWLRMKPRKKSSDSGGS